VLQQIVLPVVVLTVPLQLPALVAILPPEAVVSVLLAEVHEAEVHEVAVVVEGKEVRD
jgi:hypothetical protein